MSQAAFAASCQRAGWDVGRAVLAKIECGIRCVEDHELLELAKALRCPLADLYPARAQAVIRGKKSASGSPKPKAKSTYRLLLLCHPAENGKANQEKHSD